MGGGVGDDSGMIFLFLNGNICCNPSLGPLRWTVLMMGHNMFWRGVVEDCPWVVPLIPSYLDPLRYKKNIEIAVYPASIF